MDSVEPTTLRVQIGDNWYTVEVSDITDFPIQVLVDGEPVEVSIEDGGSSVHAKAEDDLKISDSRPRSPSTSTSGSNVQKTDESSRSFKSPMPGVIISVAVSVGDQVVTGDDICVLEAMKMQQVLRADWSGIVASVNVSDGDQVVDGEVIASLE